MASNPLNPFFMPDNLDSLSDGQLDEIMAVEILGWARANPEETRERYQHWIPPGKTRMKGFAYTDRPAHFCTDTAAVLPLLEKWDWDGAWNRESYLLRIFQSPRHNREDAQWNGSGKIFARAATTVLIRSARARRETK